ncbi:MAG TPA: DUF2550 domain-containing protein [Micromonosporaceae bacterium]|nr:DUF2550 domain-containing protein [Micromonosporaceae bacterium]
MRIFEVVGIGILVALACLIAIFIRREIISRAGGTIDMNMRLSTLVPGRGWAPGLGRFGGSELRWYRLFSLSIRPRRVLPRGSLSIVERRPPQGPERYAMPEGWTIVRCTGTVNGPLGRSGASRAGDESIELALAESAYAGLVSWLESAPVRRF